MKIKCPICNRDIKVGIKRVPEFRGMLEDLDGYSVGKVECCECGFKFTTSLYSEDAPETLIEEEIKKTLEILTNDIKINKNSYLAAGVMLSLKDKGT